MKKIALFLPYFLFLSCTIRPITKNDFFTQKALLPKEESVHYKNSVEWWYLTGNLKDVNSENTYGVEYVFFHFNPLGMKDYLMGNFAITNPNDSTFHYDYVIQRQKKHLDTNSNLNLSIQHKNRDWFFSGSEGFYSIGAKMKNQYDNEILLKTKPKAPVSLYRDSGYEQYGNKGKAGYYSYPALEAKGKLFLNNKWVKVKGDLWYDRQWNCGNLITNKVGWNWISITLDNGQKFMTYKVFNRNNDETVSSVACIDENSKTLHFDDKDMKLNALEYWKSPHSKKKYPIKWQLIIPSKNYNMVITPLLKDQELQLKFYNIANLFYWEGMCKVEADINGEKINGRAYLEMYNHKKK